MRVWSSRSCGSTTASTRSPISAPSLNELQWIQYHLDSHGSVAEMVAAAAQQRVSPLYAAVHYLACDKTGACAAFEYLGGKLVVTPGAKTLTNHSYAESVAWAAKQRDVPRGMGSLERFARASRQVVTPAARRPSRSAAAFAILDGVRSSASQWNIVYDPVHMRVHFRTRAPGTIKTLDVGKLDPSCARAVTLLDIDTDAGGDVAARLRPYDEATNRNLIERSVRRIRKQLPPARSRVWSPTRPPSPAPPRDRARARSRSRRAQRGFAARSSSREVWNPARTPGSRIRYPK